MEVKYHHTGHGDLNDKIHVITSDQPGAGGAYHNYCINFEPIGSDGKPPGAQSCPYLGTGIRFHTIDPEGFTPNGITNESLLSVVLHRLECFQAGKYPCRENEEAITQLRLAMRSLHQRSVRRVTQGVEGKLAEHDSHDWKECGRFKIEGQTLIVVPTQQSMAVKLLAEWRGWSALESMIRVMTKNTTAHASPTEDEFNFLEQFATTLAAKNGMAELRSAFARTAK